MISSDVAWLIGFWEGEGSISAYVNWDSKRHFWVRRLQWTLTQKDEYPLYRAKKILIDMDIPEKNIYIIKKNAGTTNLVVSNFKEVEKIVFMTWEGLSPRRKAQAQEAFYIYIEDFQGKQYKNCDSDILDLPIADTFNQAFGIEEA